MIIKWLIRTVDAVALSEGSEKKRAEYVERDSLPSIRSCLRRQVDVQSQSTSEAISLKDGLVSANACEAPHWMVDAVLSQPCQL